MTSNLADIPTAVIPLPSQHHVRSFEPGTPPAGPADAPERQPTVDQAADIADALISLVRTFGNLKSRLASSTDPEVASLFLLVRLVKDGPKRAKDLSETMCADQSTVSRQVAGLVKAGLIERRADPDDGRASLLVPTEIGIERVAEHFVNRGQAFEPLIKDWPHSDREHFLRLLRLYTVNMENRRDAVFSSMAASRPLQPAAQSEDASQHSHHPHDRIERSN